MIAVRNLAYADPRGRRPVLHGLDFQVSRGEILGLLGPGGAGKTVTLEILAGFIREYGGDVLFHGKELRDWGREFFERIGVSIGSAGHFLELTAAENLAYFGRLYSAGQRPVAAALEQVGLADEARTRVREFPREKRNLLALARALLHEPEAVFLDEPAMDLDPEGARRVKGLIAAQRGAGRGLVISTRDPGLAEELCDRVAFMVDGRILTLDRPRDLKRRHGGAEAGLGEVFFGLTGRRLP